MMGRDKMDKTDKMNKTDKMKWKGIVFDFDYTLGDSTEGIVLSTNYAMNRLGFGNYSEEVIKKTVGLSLRETYKALTGDNDEERGDAFAGFFRERADQVMAAHTQLYPGILDSLLELEKTGRRLGIVTTKFRYRIDQILGLCRGEGIFDLVVGAEDVKREKPDPEGLLSVIQAWEMKNEEVLYVGDSLVDAQTAKTACVPFCGVTTGTTAEEMFRRYPNKGIYDSVNQLIRKELLPDTAHKHEIL